MEVGESSNSTASKREPEKAFDGITPKAHSSSPTVVKKGPWDVFINHLGSDTKHRLASTIYHTLDLIGLRAFPDEKELDLGDSKPEDIKEVMRTVGIHIAIFSKNYAESPGCLDELCFMLETSTPILPVFYQVDPYDFRWVAQEKGLFAPAFAQYEKKRMYNKEKLENWKIALQRVSIISGHVLNNKDGDEGMLLKSIVNSVLRVIKKGPLEVAKHPVGMDEIIQDYKRCRQEYIESGKEAKVVGIVGFGGCGKTTLATEVYNRESPSFDRSCFLHDVRDAASKNALHTKQKKLLEDLRIQTVSFDNFKEGKRVLADRLKSLRVLIVLDDVGDEDQLDSLLPPEHCLGSNSLVIVTTRAEDVLTKCGYTFIYKVQPLQYLHAKQLFCWNAFSQDSPQKGFEDMVEKCLNVCKGCPLSLKVVGGQLFGKNSKAEWDSQLDEIRGILHKKIMQRPRVSYD